MIYLASPYSSPDPFVRELRYLRAMEALTKMLRNWQWAYSPIVHCHELAKIGGLPTTADFWQGYNFYMLSQCAELRVLTLEGWEASIGVNAEIVEARRIGIPVEYL